MLTRIVIGGRELPCRITMGAMLRFKRETGKDVSKMNPDETSDMITFMWACTASACNADRVEFGMSLEEFADRLDPAELNTFYEQQQAAAGDDKKKKW